MNTLEEILHKVQKALYCPLCGRNYSLDEIQLRGYFGRTLILQTVCSQGHPPILTVFLTNFRGPTSAAIKPINQEEVKQFNDALGEFDGNFQKFFEKH